MIEAAFVLKRLNNNKSFFAEMIERDILNGFSEQNILNQYSSQSYVLYKSSHDQFFFRANFWPALADDAYRNTGPNAFLYGLVHDHNFNFLTSGYAGPGYESDFFTYDHESVDGYPGEQVDYTFLERRLLGPGDVFLYRAYTDIHCQLPPESLSISLNIMDTNPRTFFREQYMFDNNNKTISHIVNRRCNPPLFDAAAQLLGDRIVELLMRLYRQHDSDFVRSHALRAAHLAASDKSATEALLIDAGKSKSLVLREWTRERLGPQRSIFIS